MGVLFVESAKMKYLTGFNGGMGEVLVCQIGGEYRAEAVKSGFRCG